MLMTVACPRMSRSKVGEQEAGRGPKEIHVDMGEELFRDGYLLHGPLVMVLDFVQLAGLALVSPGSGVAEHAIPHELVPFQLLRRADPGVGEGVKILEDLAVGIRGNHLVQLTAGHITEQRGASGSRVKLARVRHHRA